MLGFGDYIMLAVLLTGAILAGMFAFIGSGATLTVEKPYYDQYKQCSDQLDVMKTSCPDVKCETDKTGFVWGILGVVFLAFSVVFFNRKNKQIEELEREVKDRELNLDIAMATFKKRRKK